jgi:hypothetical protein
VVKLRELKRVLANLNKANELATSLRDIHDKLEAIYTPLLDHVSKVIYFSSNNQEYNHWIKVIKNYLTQANNLKSKTNKKGKFTANFYYDWLFDNFSNYFNNRMDRAIEDFKLDYSKLKPNTYKSVGEICNKIQYFYLITASRLSTKEIDQDWLDNVVISIVNSTNFNKRYPQFDLLSYKDNYNVALKLKL